MNAPQFRGNTVTANSIPAGLPLFLVHPRGITAMFDPIIAVNPRIPRYSRNPHYRAAL